MKKNYKVDDIMTKYEIMTKLMKNSNGLENHLHNCE